MNGLKWSPSEIKELPEGEWRLVVLQQFVDLKEDFKTHCVEANERDQNIENTNKRIEKDEDKMTWLQKIAYVALIVVPFEFAAIGWLFFVIFGHLSGK